MEYHKGTVLVHSFGSQSEAAHFYLKRKPAPDRRLGAMGSVAGEVPPQGLDVLRSAGGPPEEEGEGGILMAVGLGMEGSECSTRW